MTFLRHRTAAASWILALALAPAISGCCGDARPIDAKEDSAALLLEDYRGKTADDLPALVKQLGNPKEQLRAEATYYLSQMGPAAAPAVPQLVGLLKDRAPEPRMGAIYALGELRSAAQAAVPELQRLEQDPDPSVRDLARAALAKIQSAETSD